MIVTFLFGALVGCGIAVILFLLFDMSPKQESDEDFFKRIYNPKLHYNCDET